MVPLNVLLTADEIACHLDDSDAVALVAWEGFLPAAEAGFARAERCRHLIVARANPTDAPEGTINMMALIAGAEPVSELPDTAPDESAVILYTSGTTGKPKGARLTHFNLFFNALYRSTRLVPLDSDTVALATLPLFHSFGQTVMQNAPIAVGGAVVLLPRFEPKAAFDLLESHRVTFFGGLPTMYVALLNVPEADQYDLSSLKWCVSGGSAIPKEVMKAFDVSMGSTSSRATGSPRPRRWRPSTGSTGPRRPARSACRSGASSSGWSTKRATWSRNPTPRARSRSRATT